jgi:hypothetical protein
MDEVSHDPRQKIAFVRFVFANGTVEYIQKEIRS